MVFLLQTLFEGFDGLIGIKFDVHLTQHLLNFQFAQCHGYPLAHNLKKRRRMADLDEQPRTDASSTYKKGTLLTTIIPSMQSDFWFHTHIAHAAIVVT